MRCFHLPTFFACCARGVFFFYFFLEGRIFFFESLAGRKAEPVARRSGSGLTLFPIFMISACEEPKIGCSPPVKPLFFCQQGPPFSPSAGGLIA